MTQGNMGNETKGNGLHSERTCRRHRTPADPFPPHIVPTSENRAGGAASAVMSHSKKRAGASWDKMTTQGHQARYSSACVITFFFLAAFALNRFENFALMQIIKCVGHESDFDWAQLHGPGEDRRTSDHLRRRTALSRDCLRGACACRGNRPRGERRACGA